MLVLFFLLSFHVAMILSDEKDDMYDLFDQNGSPKKLKRQFRALARQFHPDKSASAEVLTCSQFVLLLLLLRFVLMLG